MAWDHIARDNLQAAQLLGQVRSGGTGGEYSRSIVSRSYYAPFSAVTHALRGSVKYPGGREMPSHQLVPGLLQRHLRGRVRPQRLRDLVAAVRRLYSARLDAEYRSKPVDESILLNSLRDASRVLKDLGVKR